LSELTSFEVSRMGAAGVMKVAANGPEFKLEAKGGAAKQFGAAVDQARGLA
jgi:hypothetical protein